MSQINQPRRARYTTMTSRSPGSPRNQAEQHGQSFEWAQFFPQFFASTFENWQSEFLQLVWQAAGLALALLGVLAVEGVR